MIRTTSLKVLRALSIVAALAVSLVGCLSSAVRIEQVLPKAQQGDAAAQFQVGRIYYYGGTNVLHDSAIAATWFRLAAEAGNPEAQNALGFLLKEGDGVAQDYAEALVWLQKSADQKHSIAFWNLGNMHRDGLGVAKDAQRAFALYLQGAELGGIQSMHDVGKAYWKGEGTSVDLVRAGAWLETARIYSLDNGDTRTNDAVVTTLNQLIKVMPMPQQYEAAMLGKELRRKLEAL